MAEKTEESSLSSESLAFLSEAKKGKLRKFAMLAKGSSIVSLVVYKKGSLEKYKKEAKESGKGLFYFGIIEGSGANLTFKLAAEDGFTSAPVKTTVLKSYLADGGFSCKPEFQIVPTLPAYSEDDESLTDSQTGLPSDSHSEPTPQPQAESPVTDQNAGNQAGEAEKLKQQLLAVLQKLVPLIKQTIAQSPQRKDELLNPIAQIKALIAAGELTQAKQVVQGVANLLKKTPGDSGKQTDSTDAMTGLLAQWQPLRTKVIDNLKRLAKFVAGTGSPQAAAAIIELKAVIANLSASPDQRGAQELIRYLNTDDVVSDVCERAVDFRSPMLAVLEKMAAAK